MNRRCVYILAYLTRLMASTAIIPTALVAGMLSFPTTCQCGADRPHEHSIFEMPGHHHGEQRTTHGGPDIELIRASTDGVTVQTPTGGATPSLAAVRAVASHLGDLPRASLPNDATLIPDGLQSVPDVPPPEV
ncbi:MAG TPA: hypothetical protein VEX37_06565 [Thermomicrobiales bacterium]|nr:hypothetical protein [Thermomicrobiales bacterium]